MHQHRLGAPRAGDRLARRASVYLDATGVVAAAAAAPAFLSLDVDGSDLATFALLAAAAITGQLLVVETGKNHGFPTAITFLVAGALLLPPALIVLLAVAMHAPDLAFRRYPSYIPTFNTANYALDGLAAWAVAQAFSDVGTPSSELRWAVAGIAGSVAFVALNHAVLAMMLRLARGHSVGASGLFSAGSLSIDLVMALVGVALAALSTSNAALVAAVVAPLLLADRLFRLMAVAGARGGQPAAES